MPPPVRMSTTRAPKGRAEGGVKAASSASFNTKSVTGMFSSDRAIQVEEMTKEFGGLKNRTQSKHQGLHADEREFAGMSGEERLNQVTSNPRLDGLINFTQVATSKDQRRIGVSPAVMSRVLYDDERQLTAAINMPIVLAIFMLFAVSFFYHYGVAFIFLQEQTLRKQLSDPALEAGSVEDVFGYLQEGFLPFLWSADKELERYEVPDVGTSQYFELIGAAKIRVQRSHTEQCEDEIVKDYYTCYYSQSWEANKSGTVAQEQPGVGPIGGWKKTSFFNRLLGASNGPSAQPNSMLTTGLAFLNRMFPGKATYRKIGQWKNVTKEQGAINVHPKLPLGAEAFPSKKTKKALEAQKALKAEKALKLSKAEKKQKRQKRSVQQKKLKKKQSSGLRPTKIFKRVLDPLVTLDGKSKKTRQLAERKAAEGRSRELRVTRPEFGVYGWVPYAFSKLTTWEFIIPMSQPLESVQKLVQEWQEAQIIDYSTLFLGTEAILVNRRTAHKGILSHVFINFLFSRGGSIYCEVIINSLPLRDAWATVILMFIWCASLIMTSMAAAAKAFAACQRSKLRTHMRKGKTALEWITNLYGWGVICGFLSERWAMRKFNKQYKDYQEARALVPTRAELPAFDELWFEDIHANVWNAGIIDQWLLFVICLNMFLLILRFFIESQGQPRLAIVVNTMHDAGVDLVHLFIVFAIIFMAFSVSGQILFGRRMEELATFEGSIAYTLQIVLGKEFDFITLTEDNYYTALIWVYSFILLVVLVLVNIVLAMIFDTYGEVRSMINEGDSLLSTAKRMFYQAQAGNHWVSNRDLLVVMKRLDLSFISSRKLRENIPDIPMRQLQLIYERAKMKIETTLKQNNNSQAQAVASVLIAVSQLKSGVRLMKSGELFKPEEGMSLTIQHDDEDGGKKKSESGGEKPRQTQAQQKAITLGTEENATSFLTYDDGQPKWLQDGLLPFLAKQGDFLVDCDSEVKKIRQKLLGAGIGNKFGDSPYRKPPEPQDKHEPVMDPRHDENGNPYEKGMGARKKPVAKVPMDSTLPAHMGKNYQGDGDDDSVIGGEEQNTILNTDEVIIEFLTGEEDEKRTVSFKTKPLGMQFEIDVLPMTVHSVLKGAGADEQGVQPGWIVETVAGTPMEELYYDEAIIYLKEQVEPLPTVPHVLIYFFTPEKEVKKCMFTRMPLGVSLESDMPLVVTRVSQGGCAWELGVQPGWVIEYVNGMPLEGLTYFVAMSCFKKLCDPLPHSGVGGLETFHEQTAKAEEQKKAATASGGRRISSF